MVTTSPIILLSAHAPNATGPSDDGPANDRGSGAVASMSWLEVLRCGV